MIGFYRRLIVIIDTILVTLLNFRWRCVVNIQKRKATDGQGVRDARREGYLLDRLARRNKSGYSVHVIWRLFFEAAKDARDQGLRNA